MTVDAIFAQALSKSTPAERTAYLDEVCAHDLTLRQRVETLLQAHEAAGDFLGKPAIQCAAEALASPPCAEATQAQAPGDDGDPEPLDFLASSDKPDSLGRLGHYEVQEVIGRGGMGIVLRAIDEKLHRVVAIKVMAPQLATSAAARKRFIREAQAAAAISHDHVVTIHAVEEADGLPYLAMQYVSGMSLQQRLDKSGPLELREIVRIGTQTAAGLAAAHAQGLIHRDIKPANILLENSVERVKITDFGLARAVADASATQTGMVTGTPQYMSPEQARGDMVDQRSDLFSLGSVLYAMCTGRPPFRADSGMGVLKRVCDHTPHPIRETNPDIPEWLVTLVCKLQAKDPADRYQSAAEVAELLNGHLAHLQHPSVVPLPAVEKPAKPFPVLRRHWATAATVLLCIVGGLGLAEATGVTKLTASVIRVLTPEGTLIVEVDDPAVKVTIEGDGGLVITGAGPQEVRLRPGSYKLKANRDGKRVSLERELVNIAQGGRETVRIKMEAPPSPLTANKGAVVLLGGEGVAERKFDTLAEAVLAASAGDTVEIRGNGPFVTEPIVITGSSPLTIRAGAGNRPVIKLAEAPEKVLLTTVAPLVLEGLDFQVQNCPRCTIFVSDGAPVAVANCRFLLKEDDIGAMSTLMDAPMVDFRNSEFLASSPIYVAHCRLRPKGRWLMDNCIASGGLIFSFDDPEDVSIRLTRNTLVTDWASVLLAPCKIPNFRKTLEDRGKKLLRVETSANIFNAGTCALVFEQGSGFLAKPELLEPKEAQALLKRLCEWGDDRNLYSIGSGFLLSGLTQKYNQGPGTQAEWNRFWGLAKTGSLEGAPRFQGGNIRSRKGQAVEKLTPDDFRLRPDSAGYRAGPDGKDLGADMDLVGPGPAYERWKTTPQYQEWLKETCQQK